MSSREISLRQENLLCYSAISLHIGETGFLDAEIKDGSLTGSGIGSINSLQPSATSAL